MYTSTHGLHVPRVHLPYVDILVCVRLFLQLRYNNSQLRYHVIDTVLLANLVDFFLERIN